MSDDLLKDMAGIEVLIDSNIRSNGKMGIRIDKSDDIFE